MIRYKKYQNKNEKNVTTFNKWYARAAVSYTHLTLPTICSV